MLNKENDERFDELVSEHGQEIACAIVDLIMKPDKTSEEYKTLNTLLNPFSLNVEIEGIQPMGGPEGTVFYLNHKDENGNPN